MDKKNLGQVFTPEKIVKKMISIMDTDKNIRILEPSSGNGAFYNELKKQGYRHVTALEIDEKIAHENAIIKDFFDHNETKYDSIIGNPPYVDFQNLSQKAKQSSKLFIAKPNLYMFFLEKCLRMLSKNGELIFVMPISWMQNSSCKKFNFWFMKNFKIISLNILPENIWANASVTTGIFKITHINHHQKGLNLLITNNGKILPKLKLDFKRHILDIKVGGASGNNKEFLSIDSGEDFVYSKTVKNNKTIKYKYEKYKDKWIRKVPKPPKKFTYQVFVNCKTREQNPFYLWKKGFTLYDASVICIYLKCQNATAQKIVDSFNNANWEKFYIKRNGRYHFSQSLLEGVING